MNSKKIIALGTLLFASSLPSSTIYSQEDILQPLRAGRDPSNDYNYNLEEDLSTPVPTP